MHKQQHTPRHRQRSSRFKRHVCLFTRNQTLQQLHGFSQSHTPAQHRDALRTNARELASRPTCDVSVSALISLFFTTVTSVCAAHVRHRLYKSRQPPSAGTCLLKEEDSNTASNVDNIKIKIKVTKKTCMQMISVTAVFANLSMSFCCLQFIFGANRTPSVA
jgi:hypothetical protein